MHVKAFELAIRIWPPILTTFISSNPDYVHFFSRLTYFVNQTRNLLRIAIFNISYIRGLFPEKYFNDKSVPALGETIFSPLILIFKIKCPELELKDHNLIFTC